MLIVATAAPVGAQAPTRRTALAAAQRERPGLATFRGKVEQILGAMDVNRGYWGMLVEDADSGEVLFSLFSARFQRKVVYGGVYACHAWVGLLFSHEH